MKVFTSYFGNAKNLQQDDIQIISIALGMPRFLPGIAQLLEVCPTRYMLSDKCSQEEYVAKYRELLSSIDVSKLYARIVSMSNGKDVALCCYETPAKFCHRHLLASWMRGQGYDVMEYASKRRPEKKVSQTELTGVLF